MSNQFVTTKKVINEILDGDGPDYIVMSVLPGDNRIDLVIGTHYGNREACSLSKEGVKELIDILRDIHEAMED
jgi:hypothetical protein